MINCFIKSQHARDFKAIFISNERIPKTVCLFGLCNINFVYLKNPFVQI